jgi:hypothetical protein
MVVILGIDDVSVESLPNENGVGCFLKNYTSSVRVSSRAPTPQSQ